MARGFTDYSTAPSEMRATKMTKSSSRRDGPEIGKEIKDKTGCNGEDAKTQNY